MTSDRDVRYTGQGNSIANNGDTLNTIIENIASKINPDTVPKVQISKDQAVSIEDLISMANNNQLSVEQTSFEASYYSGSYVSLKITDIPSLVVVYDINDLYLKLREGDHLHGLKFSIYSASAGILTTSVTKSGTLNVPGTYSDLYLDVSFYIRTPNGDLNMTCNTNISINNTKAALKVEDYSSGKALGYREVLATLINRISALENELKTIKSSFQS